MPLRNQSTYEVATGLILRNVNWAVTGNRGFGLTIDSALVGWVGVVATVPGVVVLVDAWGLGEFWFECAGTGFSARVTAGEMGWFAMWGCGCVVIADGWVVDGTSLAETGRP